MYNYILICMCINKICLCLFYLRYSRVKAIESEDAQVPGAVDWTGGAPENPR